MKREMTRTDYKKKFDKLMAEKFNYILQEGEQIVQCHEEYPPYWFISNKAYLFSVYRKKIKILKPFFDKTGYTNKDGERRGKTWRYSTMGADGKSNRFIVARLVLEHFPNCEFESPEKLEAHHIKKRTTFDENESTKCNRIDNLQLLPASIHKAITHYSSKTSADLDREMDERVKKSGCPVYQLTQEQLQEILMNALQSCTALGAQPYIVTTNITDDVAAIEAEAHPIKRVDIEDL